MKYRFGSFNMNNMGMSAMTGRDFDRIAEISKDVNIDRLVELISALSGTDIIEIRDKKTTFSKIADLATLVKKQLPDMDGKK